MSRSTDAFATWIPRQRWYATKGRTPVLREIAAAELPSSDPDAQVTVHLVIDEAHAESPVLYQVPVVARPQAVPEAEAALIAEANGRFLYDGPHDPAYAEALLRGMADRVRLEGEGLRAEGRALSDPGRVVSARVLVGEQSNTSIIYSVEGGPVPEVITKVFRVLHHGENPDVTIQSALTAAGSERVPTSFCSLVGTWPDTGRDEGSATGHLAFAQRFISGSRDAWRIALEAAERGEDFTGSARALGMAVADVHETLARALPTVQPGPDDVEAALTSLRRRLRIAAREVPALEPLAPRIDALYGELEHIAWPRLQRIHGDLHLGQALHSDETGWVLLDFEGEPLRPMPERSRPDFTVRDVAGMLRSFDYVAGSLERSTPPVDAREWASAARSAFLEGYAQISPIDLGTDRTLRDAFEIDKAVYEAIYETRNRPEWLGIPLSAVERLVGDAPHA